MQHVHNEEQLELARTARDFAKRQSPLSRLRALRDARDPLAYSPDIWKQMAALGWAGVHIPEAQGGVELGFTELSLILEAMGRQLAPEPLVASLVLGGYALLLAGEGDAYANTLLGGVAAGERIVTLAHQEHAADHVRTRCETRATQRDGSWRITGEKRHVLHGGNATELIVVARVSGERDDAAGLGLFVVDAQASGVARRALSRLDSQNAAHVAFEDVEARALGTPGDAGPVLDQILDRGTIALCVEALGATRHAFEISIEYLKTRVQFGVPIGSFQALQHRAAALFSEVELAHSIVWAAVDAVDHDPTRVPQLAAAAKATLSETAIAVAHEGVQFHGGVGVTDEYDIGLFLKRAQVFASTLGDAAWHRARWATLSGY